VAEAVVILTPASILPTSALPRRVSSMIVRVFLGFCIAIMTFAAAEAQEAARNPWKYNVGGGLSFTQGNKDTSTYNASYNVTYSPGPRRTFKSDALLLRGKTNGELSHDRFGLNLREEVRIGEHMFVFGQNQYLRDRFKRIQYLVAPTAGLGLTAVATEATTLTFDAGAGGVWEKNPYVDVRASGALTFSQKLTQAGFAAALRTSARGSFKIGALATYSPKPSGTMIRKNAGSSVFAIVMKNCPGRCPRLSHRPAILAAWQIPLLPAGPLS